MYLKVTVTTGARHEVVEEKKSGSLHIAVKEKAERNQANARVRAIVATRLGAPLARVRIVSGHHARSKMLSIS